ncbi:MAG: ABC transporter ATP-binding protein [Alphaproteobacteria bacterium]
MTDAPAARRRGPFGDADGDVALIWRLLHDYLGKRIGKVLFAAACMIGGSAMTGALAWMLNPAVKQIFMEKNVEMLILIPAAVVLIVFVRGAFDYGASTTVNSVGQSIVAETQRDMFYSFIRFDLEKLNAVHSGQFVSRFLYDATLLREATTKGIAGIGKELLTLIFLAGVMISQNWRLALISVVVLPIIGYAARELGKRMRRASTKTMKETGELSTVLVETLDGRRIVKAYALETNAIERAENRISRRLKFLIKGVRARGLSVPVADFLGGLAIAAVVAYAGYEGIQGRLELNEFAAFLGAMLLAQQPVRQLSQLWSVTTEGLGAAKRIFELIDTKPAIVDAPNAKALVIAPPPLGGNVRFRGVSFAYQEGAAALDNLTLDVPAGKKVALVGPSGAGKTTVFNLLLRFYDVGGGAIEIDGQNIASVTLASLRDTMALVTQEPFVFDESVRANIAYGRAGASEEDIIEAAKAAAAHEFIAAMPDGYDTRVGEGGLKLSGGQRQRIAIARAMLRNAPILLLDEATSSLDTENERLVQEALKRLMKGRTTIVIAHRLTTVLDADRIYVMDRGHVVEQGTHGELVARGGLYARLYKREFHDDELPAATLG